MSISIPEAMREMLGIIEKLCEAYPHKTFTMDGKLVGDIGEVLVEDAYDVKLFPDGEAHHDARCSDGRLVQIKANMKRNLTFPANHIPDYYVGVQIGADGTFVEIFNGPGVIARDAIKNRRAPKTNLHSVTVSALSKLQARVVESEKIPLRKSAAVRPTRAG